MADFDTVPCAPGGVGLTWGRCSVNDMLHVICGRSDMSHKRYVRVVVLSRCNESFNNSNSTSKRPCNNEAYVAGCNVSVLASSKDAASLVNEYQHYSRLRCWIKLHGRR